MVIRRQCRGPLFALALAAAALAGAAGPTAAASPPANRFGIYFIGPAYLQVGQALGVGYERQAIPVNPTDGGEASIIRGLEAAGFSVVVTFDNTCPPPMPGSCPVTDPAAYKASLSTQLDATTPAVAVIENEEDQNQFSSATPQQYLQELTYAVQAAHAKGYKVTNGGITTIGLNLAYWDYLWTTHPCAAADEFAKSAFYIGVVRGLLILQNIPNCQNPNRPILTGIPTLLANLQAAQTLIAGYKATGIDYINFHWYQADPVTMSRSVPWLEQTTGLQAVGGEMGQFYFTRRLIPGLLNEAGALNLPYVIWFASDGAVSYGLANPDGTLRVNGLAFKSYVATHK